MTRLKELEEILFPVDEFPVFVSMPASSGTKSIRAPGKKAIVNLKDDRVLGIVGQDYRVVSNTEALQMARKCCLSVFPETSWREWIVSGVDAPRTGGHCFIDLAHRTAKLDFSVVAPEGRPEVFGPFIRVTNSYNKARALGFDIGFQRKVCRNGLIRPESVVRFRFNHSRRDFIDDIVFDFQMDKLADLRRQFAQEILVLRNVPVPLRTFEEIARHALALHPPKAVEEDDRMKADWDAVLTAVRIACARYAHDLGENAYGLLNAITDFATRPPEKSCVRRSRHSLQQRAGTWASDFSADSRREGFTVEKYLESIRENKKKAVERPKEAVFATAS